MYTFLFTIVLLQHIFSSFFENKRKKNILFIYHVTWSISFHARLIQIESTTTTKKAEREQNHELNVLIEFKIYFFL